MLSFGLPGPALNIQGQGVTVVVRSLPFSLMHQTRPSLSVDRMVPSLQALALGSSVRDRPRSRQSVSLVSRHLTL